MAKRPADLTYWVDETPPKTAIALLSFQHVALLSIYLVVAVSLARGGGLDAEAGARLIALTMLGAGVGSILQALGRWGVGSGYLLPTTTTAILIPPSQLALTTGGPATLFGMILFSGLVMLPLAKVMPKLRALFPPEIAGFVVFMTGISVMVLAAHNLLGVEMEGDHRPIHLLVAIPTLMIIVGLSVWGNQTMRLYSTLIGMATGYAIAMIVGDFKPSDGQTLMEAKVLALPAIGSFGLAFDPALILPFLIAALAMALNSMGAITAAQKANDASWKRPDMQNIGLGTTANALTNVFAGLIGGCGQSSSPGAVGLAVASGATSRVIGIGIGILWLGLSFSPKIAATLLIMPAAVIGAALMFSGCYLVINGIQVMASRMLDARKIFALGLSLAFGLSRFYDAKFFNELPDFLQPWVSSPMALAVTMAVLLNALFRIGIHQRNHFTVDAADVNIATVSDFMAEQGKIWGAEPATVFRAAYATQEIVETLTSHDMVAFDDKGHSKIDVSTRFDEFSFAVTVSYQGELLEPRSTRPTEDEIIESDDGTRLLAAYMIGKIADRARAEYRKGRNEITIFFNA